MNYAELGRFNWKGGGKTAQEKREEEERINNTVDVWKIHWEFVLFYIYLKLIYQYMCIYVYIV